MRRLFIATALLAASCSSSDSTPAPAAPRFVARFELSGALPRFLDVPFPSDAYLDPDGTIADTIPGLDAYVLSNAKAIQATLATQRGFGINQGTTFRVDEPGRTDATTGEPSPAPIDAASLPKDAASSILDGSSVFLIDLDAKKRVPCRVGIHDDRDRGSNSPPVVAVLPARGTVLAEGHRHAAILTTRVTAGGGSPIGASATFAAIRDGARRSTPIEKLYGGAADAAKEIVPALAGGAIAAMSVFTTHAVSHELADMRGILEKLPPPKLHWDAASIAPMHAAVFGATLEAGYTATLDDWLGSPDLLPDGSQDPALDQPNGYAHDALAVIGTAEIDGPSFLRERAGGYDDPDHRTVARDAGGAPRIDPDAPAAKIWMAIALPKAPPPKSGYPVVIIQHGLQSDKSFIFSLANVFAKKGWASVAIDAITFGARAVNPADAVDQVSNFKWSPKAKYSGPDGFVDKPADTLGFFGYFLSFGAARDQLRQAAIDVGTVASIVRDPAIDLGPLLAAAPGARFDPDRIAYAGDSFGALVGSLAASVDPHIRAFCLNVGGGGVLTDVISNGPGLAIASSLGGITYGIPNDRLTFSHPLLNILQGILDPADPLAHAARWVKSPAVVNGVPNAPKNLLLTEVLWDELIANEGGEALALAGGLPLAVPNVGSNAGVTLPTAAPQAGVLQGVPVAGATALLIQVGPATHGCDLYCRQGTRHYRHPFGGDPTSYAVLPSDIVIQEPYLALQKMLLGFYESAFAGGAAQVKDIPVPVRDFDGDGKEDSMDPDPNDPSK
jgi:hypothetical protein